MGTILLGDPRTGSPITLSDLSDKTSFWVKHAINEISTVHGDTVTLSHKKLLQPGINTSLASGTAETVWLQGGDETYVSANSIDTISSSSASDTGTVSIRGHTIDGSGNFTVVNQTATLNGQTKVVLTVPLARVDEVRNTSSSNWVGDVYVYEDGAITNGVPNTASAIHIKGNSDRNRSFKAAMTAGNTEYFMLTDMFSSVSRGNNTVNIDVLLQIRLKGKVFITEVQHTTSAGSVAVLPFRPFLVIPSNADIRVVAISDTNDASCEAGFQGLFASVV